MYGSADVSLIRDANNNGRVDSGEVLASSEGSSNKLISGNRLDNLSAGTYYVRVKGNTSYGLAVNLDQAGNSRVAGSQGIFSISTARNLQTLSDIAPSQDYQFSDFVGSSLGDPVDFYSFRLDKPRSLSFALRDMTGNANVYIEDGNGTVLAKSENGGSGEELGSVNLAGSTNYYVRVAPVGSESTNYRLVLNPGQLITQIPDSAGNTPSTARQILVNRNGNTWRDWVGSSDNNDYYRFTLNHKSNLNLRLDGLSADANVEILNNNNNVIYSSTKSGSNNEEISRTLDAGTYSVRVYPQSGNTYYNLNIKADQNWGKVTLAGQNESFPVGLERVGDDGKGSPKPIESGRNTWVVIHGFRGQPSAGEFPALAKALDAADDQVLTLDWSSIANDKYGGDSWDFALDLRAAANWIPTVADWASKKLKDLGFDDKSVSQNKLNLVGFSLGAYVAAEIASLMPGGVNKIVALDPASTGGLGSYSNKARSIKFSDNSQFSWGFYGSGAGDPGRTATADESWSVGLGSNNPPANHGRVVNLFASMVDQARTNSNPVSTYFGINKMGLNIHTPLQLNQYDETGSRVSWGLGGPFEGRLEARQDNNQRWVPKKLEYMRRISDINTITA
jgi:pimeloyl-ACP methyl ester carboxylesterase